MNDTGQDDARRALAIRLATSLDVSMRHEIGKQKFWLSDTEMGLLLDALRASPERAAEEMREQAIAAGEAEIHEIKRLGANAGTCAGYGLITCSNIIHRIKRLRADPLPQETGDTGGRP
jgi:hypothetical protein